MATVTTAQIQQIYIGYLGRAADQEGLNYWVEQITNDVLTLEQLRANITNEQQEYTEGYGQMERADLVEAVYQSLFERSADAEGLTYWTEGEGKDINDDQLILAILSGASEADQTILDNKTEVAEYYTAQMGENYDAESAKSSIDSVDATEESVTAGKTAVDSAAVSGSTFELTSETDTIVGTADNDLITGTSENLSSDDRITDISTTDNDILNIAATADLTGDRAMDVTNVENINVDWDAFGTADIDLDNVTGATVTVSSDKSGYLGNASFTNAGTNNVTLGAGITGTVTIAAIEDATVEAGSADTVTITNADGDLTVNADNTDTVSVTGADDLVLNAATATDVTVAGTPRTADITLGVDADLSIAGASAEYTIRSTDDITLDLAAGSTFESLTIAGENAVTLNVAQSADLNEMEIINGGAIVLEIDAGGDLDLSAVTNTSLTYETSQTTGTHTVATGANLIAEDDFGANITFATSSDDDSAADEIRLTVQSNQGADLIFNTAEQDFETVTIVADAEEVEGDDVTLHDVQAGEEKVVFQSAVNELTVSDIDAGEVDATAVAGDFSLETNNTAEMIVAGGSADNTIVFAATAEDSTYVGQDGQDTVTFANDTGEAAAVVGNGENEVTANSLTTGQLSVMSGDDDDTVSATALTSGKVSAALGEGDNTVTLDGTFAGIEVDITTGAGDDVVHIDAATVAADEITLTLGAGTDTLNISENISAGTLTVSGLEVIAIDDASTAATVSASLLDGQSYTISGDGDQADQLSVVMATTNADVDFSELTIDNTIDEALGGLSVTGSSAADTIVLSEGADTLAAGDGDDTITGGAGADNLNGGAGEDTYVITGHGDLVTQADVAAVTEDGSSPTDSTEEEMTNADSYEVITWADGDDTIDLSAFDADADTAGTQAWAFGSVDDATTSDAIDVTGTEGEIDFQIGTYDDANGDFTHVTGGNDAIMVLNDGTNTSVVVLVGGATITAEDFVLS